ncbi:MAG: helix-turn-helix transcriptional regulator [Acidimicrobiia bacterium]|nr:helix-turn-helix transcriptional regulator [Acidimicrobiia bacterium]
MDAAQVLRTARTRRGLTQAQLATRAGTSQPVISAYEHGRRDPSIETLRRLVAAAGERLEVRSGSPPSDLPPLASPEAHAAALVDVLLLADAVPARRAPAPTVDFPRICSGGGER